MSRKRKTAPLERGRQIVRRSETSASESNLNSPGGGVGFRFECVCGRSDAKADPGHGYLGPRWFVNCYSSACSGEDYPAMLAEAVDCPSAYDLLSRADYWLRDRAIGESLRRHGPSSIPTMAEIREWHEALFEFPKLVAYLETERGISRRTIKRNLISLVRGGLAPRPYPNRNAFTLPVFDAAGAVLTVRRRFQGALPEDEDGRPVKAVGLDGHPVALYPNLPEEKALMLVAGEFDALAGRSRRLPTVTTTSGASLPDPLLPRFVGRVVAVMFDAQESEQVIAAKVVDRLRSVGADAWRVDLRDAGLDNGEDLTDWFVSRGRTASELRMLANRARGTL